MKPLDHSIPAAMWLLVELERDRQTRPRRRDVRDGCQAVEELFKWYGKIIPWETVRRQYKAAEKLRKTPEIAAIFDRHLAELRRKREAAGWKADPFLLMGYSNEQLIAMFPNMLRVELRQRLNKKAEI
jgi:hypothetical protein